MSNNSAPSDPTLNDPFTLAQRIRNGEDIPLSDLIDFIKGSETVLRVERKSREIVTEKDVDF